MTVIRRGSVIILSAPSGAGKSTIARHLLANLAGVRLSVSTTTRAPRPGEEEGVHYHFVTPEQFRDQVAAGEFLEWAAVFGNSYGTARSVVEQSLAAGLDVLLDIDWQGARQIRKLLAPEDVVGIFVAPPAPDELRRRLELRGQDAPEVIAHRMERALAEMTHWNEYDYIVINHHLEHACIEVEAIVRSTRLRRNRQQATVENIVTLFTNSI